MSLKDKMTLGVSHRRQSSASAQRSSNEEARDPMTNGEDETVVDEQQGNIIMHIISQLKPGADLSRVTLPTFILEPRSMLERITNFMAHPEMLLPIPDEQSDLERFKSVVKFYLSGWHIRPPGVKKPLNPILGETFTCYWDYPDNTRGYYISEQTSHHPPKSSYFFMIPYHNIRIDGTLKPRSKFFGNSAGSMMEGIAVMRFLNRPDEKYFVTQPNIYSRNILIGKMKYELGDHSFVRCPKLNLEADIEFKAKPYFGGTYNAIGGCIREIKTGEQSPGKQTHELSGQWSSDMYLKDLATKQKELLFSVRENAPTPPLSRPIAEQEERESQRLWKKVTDALKRKDQDGATEEKTRIEDMQREEAARRTDQGVEWRPRLFRPFDVAKGDPRDEAGLDWVINANIDGKTPEEQTKQILHIAPIIPGQVGDRRFSIPERRASRLDASSQQQQQQRRQPQSQASETASLDHAPAAAVTAGADSSNQHDQTPAPPHTQTHDLRRPPDDKNGEEKEMIPEPEEGEPGHSIIKKLQQMKMGEQNGGAGAGGGGGTEGMGNRLRRMDSETNETDEFVDAES